MKATRLTQITTICTLSAGLALAGCSSSGGDSSSDSPAPDVTQSESQESGDSGAADSSENADDSSSASTTPEDADLSTTKPSTSAEDAVKTAEDKVKAKDGILHTIELDFDSDDGKWEYDIKIMDGDTDHKVVIDADSGKVIRDESESSDDSEKSIDLKSPMTYDEAFELAKKKASGTLAGWKLEYDDGQREYQFDFDDNGDEVEVTVDVESKNVTTDD
ncbi:PepSY domain-containing protein [Brevibacterium atlanticum]|uniref:PepSY domain-containing protein n=1 Tax=Brevibacterium atlanticum TaxID=2697563 RepID=UPI00142099DF|nr:PepSY domain-containing protein [Brevibacterium atlanticum]